MNWEVDVVTIHENTFRYICRMPCVPQWILDGPITTRYCKLHNSLLVFSEQLIVHCSQIIGRSCYRGVYCSIPIWKASHDLYNFPSFLLVYNPAPLEIMKHITCYIYLSYHRTYLNWGSFYLHYFFYLIRVRPQPGQLIIWAHTENQKMFLWIRFSLASSEREAHTSNLAHSLTRPSFRIMLLCVSHLKLVPGFRVCLITMQKLRIWKRKHYKYLFVFRAQFLWRTLNLSFCLWSTRL